MDVTARKQAEASPRGARNCSRSAQLEHVARVATLGELTATLTHELKQPLSAILINSARRRCMFLDAPKPDLQEVRGTLADIGEITQRAGEMIGGHARHAQARHAAASTDVDLNHLIRTVERIVHSDAVLHRVTVQLDLSPDVRPVKGDGVQLQQVVLNLMLNAFGAMSGRRASTARRRLIVRTDADRRRRACWSRCRTAAPGSPRTSSSRSSSPSSPASRTAWAWACRSAARSSNATAARIWAANNPDRGATFSITLPVTGG